jgi:class 3 adenylate cyclase
MQAPDWAAGQRPLPFDSPPYRPGPAGAARLEGVLGIFERSPNAHGLGRRLSNWMLEAPEIDAQRIRPLDLARQWNVEKRDLIEACLQRVKDGLLQLRWDLLCPRCRGAKMITRSLDQVPTEAHCTTCNISYDRDFTQNIELSFQPNPAIRPIIVGEFCLFGPMTTPHIKVQLNLAPGEEKTVEIALEPGPYRLRTLQIGEEDDFDFDGDRFPEVVAAAGEVYAGPRAEPGIVRLINREKVPRTLIVESREWVRDALTAHRVTTMQCFRDLFPGESLRQGDAVDISRVALVFTDLKGSTAFFERVGDVEAYRLVREHFAFLGEAIREHDGAIVKTIGDAVMAVFVNPLDAVRATLTMQTTARAFREVPGQEDIGLKVGVHTGACVAVALNDRLDYFGTNVNMAARLQGESDGGEVVLSREVYSDPGVMMLLDDMEVVEERGGIRGFEGPITFYRLTPDVVEKALLA